MPRAGQGQRAAAREALEQHAQKAVKMPSPPIARSLVERAEQERSTAGELAQPNERPAQPLCHLFTRHSL